MSLLAYELSFLNPIKVREHKLSSKRGFVLRVDDDKYIAHGDVSPLYGLSNENIDDVALHFQKIPLHKFIDKIEVYLEDSKHLANFKQSGFLSYDFSSWTNYPSLQFGLCCALSELFRNRHNIKLSGKIRYQALVQGDPVEMLQKVLALEESGFALAKIKIGKNSLTNERQLLEQIFDRTKSIRLRLDANQMLSLDENIQLLKNLPKDRIDYVEDPLKVHKDLDLYIQETQTPFAIDENLNLFKSRFIKGLKAIIIKPTLIGDFLAVTNIIESYRKIYGDTLKIIFSSSYESQLGIFQIAQMALSMSPNEIHGLDTFDSFLEELVKIETLGDTMFIGSHPQIRGPQYV